MDDTNTAVGYSAEAEAAIYQRAAQAEISYQVNWLMNRAAILAGELAVLRQQAKKPE